jgi:hypothetical protein
VLYSLGVIVLARKWVVDVGYVVAWLDSLDEGSRRQVVAAIEILKQEGPQLGRPMVDSVKGSRHSNMKELRPGSTGKSELRVLFAFDPRRHAILLLGGDKAGSWRTWYSRNIVRADRLLDQHIQGLTSEET